MADRIQTPELNLPGIAHGFFTRSGGVSEGIYASLNCGLGSKDDKALIAANRSRVATTLGARPGCLVSPWQIHSASAIQVDAPWPDDETRPKADGVVTATPGLAIGVLTADCTPILFADAEARVIGAAHAGWRGALGGIIEATVAAMEVLGARRGRMAAAVGPCIGPDAYEVGPEFEAEFIAVDRDHGRFFVRSCAAARPYFDLPGFVAARLRALGLGAVAATNLCTYRHPERFYSYRRATHLKEADYGRQISAILLT